MIRQAGVIARSDESAAGFDSAVLFVRLGQKGEGGDKQGRIHPGGDKSAVDLLPLSLELYGAAVRRKFPHRVHYAIGKGRSCVVEIANHYNRAPRGEFLGVKLAGLSKKGRFGGKMGVKLAGFRRGERVTDSGERLEGEKTPAGGFGGAAALGGEVADDDRQGVELSDQEGAGGENGAGGVAHRHGEG